MMKRVLKAEGCISWSIHSIASIISEILLGYDVTQVHYIFVCVNVGTIWKY